MSPYRIRKRCRFDCSRVADDFLWQLLAAFSMGVVSGGHESAIGCYVVYSCVILDVGRLAGHGENKVGHQASGVWWRGMKVPGHLRPGLVARAHHDRPKRCWMS
jgi:hypothetical protein